MSYPTQTYPQPPAEPPKKKHRALKVIGIILASIVGMIIVLVTLAVVFGGEEETAAPAAGASPSAKPKTSEVPTAKIGDKVTDESYEFTVTKVSCGTRRVGDQYSGEKAQGQFCLVTMRIKNVGNDPITFASENQALVDTKGRTYSPDDEAWVYVDDSDDLWGEINPGNTLKTVVPFDVPKNVEPDYLLLKAGTFGFSEGVRVKL